MNVRAFFASAAICGAVFTWCGQTEAQVMNVVFGYAGGATFKGEVAWGDYGCGGYGGCGGSGCGKHGCDPGRGSWIHYGSSGGCSSGGCSSGGKSKCGRGKGRLRGGNGGCDSGCNGDNGTYGSGYDYYSPAEGGINLAPQGKQVPTPAPMLESPVPPGESTARNFGLIRSVSLVQSTDASFAAGWLAYRSGNFALSIETLNSVVSAEPHNAAAAYGLALAHFDLGHRDAADAALAQAVAVESEHPVAGFGKLMERVQGSRRVWLEAARR